MITILDIANEFETVVRHFNSMDTLSHATREVSVQHGRDILEKLRMMADGEDSGEALLDIDETRLEMAEMLLAVSKAFLGAMAEIAKKNKERLADKEASPVFEKTVDAIGKVSYKVRDFVVNTLIKQGKAEEAEEMKATLEATTPARFKAGKIYVADLINTLEAGIAQTEILEKKIAAELRAQKAQKQVRIGADAKNIVSDVSGYHTILEVNERALIPSVQEVRVQQDKAHSAGPHRVMEVSEEGLVHSAQKANESREKLPAHNKDLSQNN